MPPPVFSLNSAVVPLPAAPLPPRGRGESRACAALRVFSSSASREKGTADKGTTPECNRLALTPNCSNLTPPLPPSDKGTTPKFQHAPLAVDSENLPPSFRFPSLREGNRKAAQFPSLLGSPRCAKETENLIGSPYAVGET